MLATCHHRRGQKTRTLSLCKRQLHGCHIFDIASQQYATDQPMNLNGTNNIHGYSPSYYKLL